MLNVPVEVKDALKDGRMRKNYRIVVYRKVIEKEYYNIFTFTNVVNTTTFSAHYNNAHLYCADNNHAFDYAYYEEQGGASRAYACPTPLLGQTDTDFLIPNTLQPTGTLTVSGMADDVELQLRVETGEKESWVEDFTIDNNTLIKESVSIDERMCSGDTIKFGLCEGSSLEFQYFDHPNITDRQVQVFCDVEYGADEPYPIPMGFFTVKNCSRQASTGIIKATAYNKLQSDYLDAKANNLIISAFPNGSVSLLDITNYLLNGYQIEEKGWAIFDTNNETYEPNVTHATARITTGDDTTPLSGYNAIRLVPQLTTSTNIRYKILSEHITIDARESDADVGRLKADLFSLKDMSYDFVQFLKNVIDSSNLTITGQAFIDGIKNVTDGWRHIFSVVLDNGTTQKYYADYPVLEGQQGTTYTFDGTIEDLLKNSININEYVVNIYIPKQIKAECTISGAVYTCGTANFINNPSRYYVRTSTGYAYYPLWKYPSGKDVNNSVLRADALRHWIYIFAPNDVSSQDLITVNPQELPEVTLREIISSMYEIDGLFGQMDRVTDLFSGVELNNSRLYPQETLYPNNYLYPDGAVISSTKAMYSQLWADEGNVRKWRNLIITYKGLDSENKETDFVYIKTVNPDGTDDYICSDNWLFKNLVWTEQQITEYANTMANKMANIVWFPFEMWCAGLPYLETGDEIEIPLNNNTYRSYVLRRSLKGIQNLQDTYINGTLDIF